MCMCALVGGCVCTHAFCVSRGYAKNKERKGSAIQTRASERRMEREKLNGEIGKNISLGMTCHPSLNTLTN